jgi:hypothetical protein
MGTFLAITLRFLSNKNSEYFPEDVHVVLNEDTVYKSLEKLFYKYVIVGMIFT